MVDAAQLPEIGELVRPGDVADRREDSVLHHWSQQYVRAESGRALGCLLHEGRGGISIVADDETAVLLTDRSPATFQMEEREAVVLRVHLRVIAARCQIRSGERRELDGLARHRQFAGKDLADQRLGRGIGRVVDHQAAIAENVLDPAAECVGHPNARLVGSSQAGHHVVAEFRWRQQLFEFVEGFVNRVGVEADGGNRGWVGAGPRRKRNRARRQRVIEDGTRPDLLPVVIFGVDPEHRDRRNVVIARDLLGQFDRRHRLQQREQRSAEQPGLLAGDDRDRASIRKQAARGDGVRRRTTSRLLAPDHVGDRIAATVVRLRSRNRIGPGGTIGWVA
jgi:hypothetical protein